MRSDRLGLQRAGKRLLPCRDRDALLMHQRFAVINPQHALRLRIGEHRHFRLNIPSFHRLIGQIKRRHLNLRRLKQRFHLHCIKPDPGISRRLCGKQRIALRRHAIRKKNNPAPGIAGKQRCRRIDSSGDIGPLRILRGHIRCKIDHLDAPVRIALRSLDPSVHVRMCRRRAAGSVGQDDRFSLMRIQRDARTCCDHDEQYHFNCTKHSRRAIRSARAFFSSQQENGRHTNRHRNRRQQKNRGFKKQINIFHGDTSPIPQAAAGASAARWCAPDKTRAPAPSAFPPPPLRQRA